MPKHGHRYNITLFYSTDFFPAVYYIAYTDLFGNSYTHLFMDDTGRIFEISNVQKWEQGSINFCNKGDYLIIVLSLRV